MPLTNVVGGGFNASQQLLAAQAKARTPGDELAELMRFRCLVALLQSTQSSRDFFYLL